MMPKTTVLIGLLAAAFIGCLDTSSYTTPDRSEKVAKFILQKAPNKIQFPADADLEGKIALLGYDLNKNGVLPGEEFEVTWYWKCLSTPGPGWRLFTHALDAEGRSRANKDKDGQIRKYFQPEHWLPGMIIRDVQPITVPKNWKSDYIELRTGIWKGDSRLSGKGQSVDERQRIIGPRIKVRITKDLAIKVPKTKVAPKIDGIIDDDPAWQSAAKLSPFLDTLKGEDVKEATDVRLTWDDKNLYIAMRGDDTYLKTQFDQHDQEIWKEDAFEIFLDPNADKKSYYELQVSPKGIVFDSYLPAHRQNQNEWTSDMLTKVVSKGTINDNTDKDTEWSAELAIPFAKLDKDNSKIPVPGTTWRANFFRVNTTDRKTEYSAWSPPMRGDFHALDRFGAITFVDKVQEKDQKTSVATGSEQRETKIVETKTPATTAHKPSASRDED